MAELLRRACVDERLSSETFAGRVEMVYAARTRAELDRLLADLPEPSFVRRVLLDFVAWSSRLSFDVVHAWRRPRMPQMILSQQERVVIGRSPDADFVVVDPAVSSIHAVLTFSGGTWSLEDGRSTNGTWVNGWRVSEPVLVRPGDELTVGETTFVLVTPRL